MRAGVLNEELMRLMEINVRSPEQNRGDFNAQIAMLMTGDSYDCGKKMGYMQAFVKYGLRNLKEGPKFRKSIEKLLSE